MSLYVRKESGTAYNPVFLKILEDVVGGVMIVTDRVPSDVKELKAGTLIAISPNTTGYSHFLKTGKSNKTQAAATAIQLVRQDPVLFKVGDYLVKDGGTTASTITRIATSTNTVWIATGTAIGTLATASRVHEGSAAAGGTATGATYKKFDPDAILKNNIQVRDDNLSTLYNVSAGAVVRGTVVEALLPYYISDRDKTELTDRIRFA